MAAVLIIHRFLIQNTPNSLCPGTVKTQIIGRCAMSLELPPLLRSGIIFIFFMFLKGAEQLCFCFVLHPFSKVGNSRLHSTPTDYLSFYGRGRVPGRPGKPSIVCSNDVKFCLYLYAPRYGIA